MPLCFGRPRRQRRTLRRAQERAIKALMDMQTQLLGIDGEQVGASALAAVPAQRAGPSPSAGPLAQAPTG